MNSEKVHEAEFRKQFLEQVLEPAFRAWLQEADAGGLIQIEYAAKLKIDFVDFTPATEPAAMGG